MSMKTKILARVVGRGSLWLSFFELRLEVKQVCEWLH